MIRLRPFLFLCAIAVMALVAAPTQATSVSYSAGGSASLDFGDLGGFWSDEGGSTTEVFDIGFSGNAGIDFLGCSGISLEGFMDVFANFEHIFDSFLNNIKKAFFRRLLVEAFSRLPQIGALFDTINALGNARFEMFNESCDISGIRSDAKALMEKRCIEAGGDTVSCNSATAQSSLFSDTAKKVNAQLTAFNEKMSNIGVPLGGTICKDAYASGACGLMSFLPQMKLCLNASVGSGSGGGTGVGGCTETRTSAPPIASDQTFTTSFFIGQQAVSAMGSTMRAYTQTTPMDLTQYQITKFQKEQEKAARATTTASLTPQDDAPFQMAFIDFDYDVAQFASSGSDEEIEKFKKFLHCSKSDPLENMKEFLDSVGGTSASSNLKVDSIAASDILNFSANGTEMSNYILNNAAGGMALIETAVGCVLNHQLHISLDTFLALTQLPVGDQKAYEKAAANRIAYLTTEVILRYMRHKVLEAHATLAAGQPPEESLKVALANSGASADEVQEFGDVMRDADIPEPILIATKTIADMFENQIQALRAVRLERDAFADMSSVIYKKISANKLRARGVN